MRLNFLSFANRLARRGYIKRALLTFIGLMAVIVATVAWLGYNNFGRTPGELMDYADRRLIGHPRLETATKPVLSILRRWLDEPTQDDRKRNKFQVPRPPALMLQRSEAPFTERFRPDALPQHIWRVGPLENIRKISDAAKIAKDGDIVEIQAGEYHGDIALWHQKRLTIRGIGGHARLFADGRSAEGKAIWVFRDGQFDVSSIDFIGAKVDDKNGAGIRFEGGHLRIKNCLFWNNENGVLTTGNDKAKLEIEDSEFGYSGAADGLSHNLYVGQIASLRVTGSYFHHANIGHLLKSRAARNEILYNRFTDESGGRASYELDLPNGGVAIVIGNIFQQGRDTENSTMVAFGLEGLTWPRNKLYLASNTLINDHPYGGAFLRTAPTIDGVVSANNLLIGKGKYHSNKNVLSVNDVHGGWEFFKRAADYDYRLSDEGRKYFYQNFEGFTSVEVPLLPQSEYLGSKTKAAPLLIKPLYVGALQN